jgi:integrase
MTWWLKTYSSSSPSHKRNVSAVRTHIQGSELADLRLVDVTKARVEAHLLTKEKAGECGPQTINHIRTFLVRAFNRAILMDRFVGKNPVLAVPRRKVPKRKPDYLRADEVPRVLRALDPRWRPLFACAIYTGMRKGELLALRKSDVDLATGLVKVVRSHQREVTKGQHEEVIPIAEQLLPYLKTAMASAPTDLVFPGADGGPMRADVKLEHVLRRALGRAGIVLGYEHVCRRKGCGHRERAADAILRRCPTDQRKLWPKALVRKLHFHHLRHTTGSLMMMAGANPGAVQKMLRHSDPRVTMDFYAHLAPGYLRDEVNRLRFDAPEPGSELAELPRAANAEPFAASLLQEGSGAPESLVGAAVETLKIQAFMLERDTGSETSKPERAAIHARRLFFRWFREPEARRDATQRCTK